MMVLFLLRSIACREIDKSGEETLHDSIADEADSCHHENCREIEYDLNGVRVLAKMCHAKSSDGDGQMVVCGKHPEDGTSKERIYFLPFPFNDKVCQIDKTEDIQYQRSSMDKE